MPISNAHLEETTRVWDGLEFRIMDLKEAKRLERDGLVQCCEGLSAAQLKSAKEFNEVREMLAELAGEAANTPAAKPRSTAAKTPAAKKPAAKKPAAKKTYNTRQMKAG